MLGLRATFKNDLHTSPAELVCGRCLRLPGELVSPLKSTDFEYGDFIECIRNHMRQLKFIPTRERVEQVHQAAALSTCPYVFLRTDAVRTPLQPPYTGPHRVLRP
ncbi:unnamed protein product [Echinostoma caproni]|uniref:NADH dehydrogenase [ubiquinone] iron-sulfur protein 7, mitochondrial n=1 Tax=Echinostoma caproni TaxID=27848 RepID=A0A183BEC3_9TREM|nr:unnamed protein product [Echinostoma caproni]